MTHEDEPQFENQQGPRPLQGFDGSVGRSLTEGHLLAQNINPSWEHGLSICPRAAIKALSATLSSSSENKSLRALHLNLMNNSAPHLTESFSAEQKHHTAPQWFQFQRLETL